MSLAVWIILHRRFQLASKFWHDALFFLSDMTLRFFHQAPLTSWDKNHAGVWRLKLCQNSSARRTTCHLSVFSDRHLSTRDWDWDFTLAIGMICLVATDERCDAMLRLLNLSPLNFGFESPTHQHSFLGSRIQTTKFHAMVPVGFTIDAFCPCIDT